MEYDQFRQMVLGANLFPLKPGQAQAIFNPNLYTLNSTAKFQNTLSKDYGYNEEIVRNTLNLELTDKLEAPRNIVEFDKFFSKKCTDSMQRYTYLRLM
jgi:hypothetical protein